MSTQTIQIHTFDYGASLSSATLRSIADDTLVATADSVNEVTADSGLYAVVFGEASVIAAGTYRLRAIVSGQPINRYVTLAGTDNEVAQARSERLAELDSASRAAILTQELIESYAADGAAPTVAQALMMILQHHQQKSVSGTTVTIKKLDKSTTASTYTLDSATDPTSITRAT